MDDVVEFSVTTAGGQALAVKSSCQPLRDILKDLRDYGYAFGSTISIKGEEVDEDYVPEEGDEIETHEPAGGS